MQFPPIATTTVGSFPRPSWLADCERSQVTFRLEGASLLEAQDDATLVVLREQEEVGLDLLTDGEQRRPHFINYVLESWEGLDVVGLGPKGVFRRRARERLVPRVVGKIRRRRAPVVEDLRFAKATPLGPSRWRFQAP